MKGEYSKECYRSICSNTPAVWFNQINIVNHDDSIKLFGHKLCTYEG